MAEKQAPCCVAGCTERPTTAVEPAAGRLEVATRPNPVRHLWSPVIGGAFGMGASQPGRFPLDGEWPQRNVVVSEFSIACHAVTNAHFADFVRDTGYVTDAERFGWSFVFESLVPLAELRLIEKRSVETPWWIAVPRAYWAQPEGPHTTVIGRLRHPVVHISWNDSRAYCDWSQARLPTEAEWEFAARGGLENALYPWGDELMPGGEHSCNIWQGTFPDHNTAEDGYIGTAPVDAYQPNGYGLHNMAGNVWEWCQDNFSQSYREKTSALDPLCIEASDSRSMRGGSFLCHESYCNRYRVAARSSNTADSSSSNIGFRVVRNKT
jgi:formylglycine-generating enzyme required for sulfatase activity